MQGIHGVVVAKASLARLTDTVVRHEPARPFAAAQVARHHVHLKDVGPAVIIEIRDVHAHASEARVLEPLGSLVGERSVSIVDIHDIVGHDIVGDVDVGSAVSVQIGNGNAEPIAGLPQDARLSADIGERTIAVVAVELVVAVGGHAAHTDGHARHLPAREISGRVVEQKEVEAPVPVVVQESRVRAEAGVGNAVLRSRFREGAITVVDEQQIRPIRRLGPLGAGHGNVNIQIPVAVDVHHGHAGDPSLGGDACGLGDVLKSHVPLVQVQSTRDHVAGKEDVRQSVVIDVTHSDPGAVVHIDVSQHIECVTGGDGVGEGDAGLCRAQEFEQRAIRLPGAAGEQQRDQECEPTGMMHAREPRFRGNTDDTSSGKAPANLHAHVPPERHEY